MACQAMLLVVVCKSSLGLNIFPGSWKYIFASLLALVLSFLSFSTIYVTSSSLYTSL